MFPQPKLVRTAPGREPARFCQRIQREAERKGAVEGLGGGGGGRSGRAASVTWDDLKPKVGFTNLGSSCVVLRHMDET